MEQCSTAGGFFFFVVVVFSVKTHSEEITHSVCVVYPYVRACVRACVRVKHHADTALPSVQCGCKPDGGSTGVTTCLA